MRELTTDSIPSSLASDMLAKHIHFAEKHTLKINEHNCIINVIHIT
uniref:Uncharacterized protein n=1 Tax=Anguilla anguilla TaxID=7936 RepID=A0A0E9XXB0_ANGAN